MSDLPPGFVLDQPQSAAGGLPPGFVMDAPAAKPAAHQGIAERLWSGLGDIAMAVPRLQMGIGKGILGEGIPEGKASQFKGGRAEFAGRAVGTGMKNIAEGLWEGLIKAPGKMVTGEMQPGPEAEAAARGMAMGMAGAGGFAPGKVLPGLAERPPRLTLGGQPPAPPGPVGGNTRMATVQMPSGPPRTVQSPPLTQEQMPPTPAGLAASGAPAPRPPPPSDPQADAATVSLYRQAVLPSRGQRSRSPQMDAYNRGVVTGVDEIIGNQRNLQLTGPNGSPLPLGSTVPRNMKQFSEAIDQSEKTLFEQWNPMTQKVGDAGLRINLIPVAEELRSLMGKPEVALVNPQVASQLKRFADDYEAVGVVTPLEAQKMVTGINARLTGFYQKGEAASGAPAEVLEPVARLLRKQLDEGIEGAIGPGWQELRNKYGALRSLDKDVTKAAERLANRPSGLLSKAGNLLASREFAHALITLNPGAMARAIGTKGAVELHRLMNDPNLMIERMFRQRMKGPPQTVGSGLDPALMSGVRAGAIDLGNDTSRDQGGVGYKRPPWTSIGGP